jgi:hypothetical protein
MGRNRERIIGNDTQTSFFTNFYMKEKIRLFLKFNKYAIIILLLGVAWTIDTLLIQYKLCLYTNPWSYLLYLPVTYAAYWSITSFLSYGQRIQAYIRLKKLYQEQGVKKSFLYYMREVPCSAEVTDELCKEFDVKL